MILVTGSSGFIGSMLCESLLAQGCEVIGLDNHNTYYNPKLKEARLSRLKRHHGFTFLMDDIRNKEGIDLLFKKFSPQKVVHLAAQAGVRFSIENPAEYISNNVNGFFNIIEACKKYSIDHFIYASSSSVYGGNRDLPFSESQRTAKPLNLYAASKIANEAIAESYSAVHGLRTTGLRFFTVYGPWGRPDMALFKFAIAISMGLPVELYGKGDHFRDFTYISDVVGAIKSIILNPTLGIRQASALSKVYNIASGNPVQLLDYLSALEEGLGTTAKKIYLPAQAGDMKGTFANIERVSRDFGYCPQVSYKEGVSRFAEWFKSEGLPRFNFS